MSREYLHRFTKKSIESVEEFPGNFQIDSRFGRFRVLEWPGSARTLTNLDQNLESVRKFPGKFPTDSIHVSVNLCNYFLVILEWIPKKSANACPWTVFCIHANISWELSNGFPNKAQSVFELHPDNLRTSRMDSKQNVQHAASELVSRIESKSSCIRRMDSQTRLTIMHHKLLPTDSIPIFPEGRGDSNRSLCALFESFWEA